MAKSPTPPGDLDPFRESMKIFSDMRFGAMPDLEGLAAAQRRNLEALSAANRVALEEAGVKDVRIYFGSWNEWSRDPGLPIEEGLPYETRVAA